MAKRGMSGQINMFDFFSGDGMDGDVEMVSLFPGDGSFEDISDGSGELASGIQEIVEDKIPEAPKDEPKPKPEPVVVPEPVVEEVKPEPKVEEVPEVVVEEPKEEPVATPEPEPDVKVYTVKKNGKKLKRDVTIQELGESAIMHKEMYDEQGKVIGRIAFCNYNKVCLQLPGEEMREYQFNSSKEAVDFYIGEIWKFGEEE